MVSEIPLDRLMIETDAPFLTPRNMPRWRSHRMNEPAFLTFVLTAVSGCCGLSEGELGARTTANARRFFRLPES